MISKPQFDRLKNELEEKLSKEGYPCKLIYDNGHLYMVINISKIKKQLNKILHQHNIRTAKIYLQDDWNIIIKI